MLKIWKEASSCYQDAIKFFGKKTYQSRGGIASGQPGHNLVIIRDTSINTLGNTSDNTSINISDNISINTSDNTSVNTSNKLINTLYFQTLIDKVDLEKEQIISLFGHNECDETKCRQLILPFLDFSGKLYLLHDSTASMCLILWQI